MSIQEIEVDEIKALWIRKKGMKNVYIQIKDDNVIIKSNPRYPIRNVQNLLALKKEWIKKHLLSVCKKEFYYLGTLQSDSSKITKENAQTLMRVILEDLSKKHDFKPNRVNFKFVKTIWGSCSSKNNINLNINLMQTPLECIEYVIAHELAHTRVKNHSKKFWLEVEKILPDYKKRRKLLREYEKKIVKVLAR